MQELGVCMMISNGQASSIRLLVITHVFCCSCKLLYPTIVQ